jgi:cob(I)alamin adenosyltransferase
MLRMGDVPGRFIPDCDFSMKLDRIYTRGGDTGQTSLGDGARVPKYDVRIRAIGGLEEANAALGVALVYIDDPEVRAVLTLAQNDIFDVGADLARPERDSGKIPLRVTGHQVVTVEQQIDRYNESLLPLTSFVLPGGSAASAHLHLARTLLRGAERDMAELAANASINAEVLKYVNRLSDLLFVLGRYLNGLGKNDVLWQPGQNRE